MNNQKTMFSTGKGSAGTPPDFYAVLSKRYGPFDLDPATSEDNPLNAPAFYTPKEDGLAHDWIGRVFLNPPYGRGIDRWMMYAWLQTCDMWNAERVVCLVPARTDTRWWHDWVEHRASEIHFLKGRIKFVGEQNAAPFPSAIVVYERELTIA